MNLVTEKVKNPKLRSMAFQYASLFMRSDMVAAAVYMMNNSVMNGS